MQELLETNYDFDSGYNYATVEKNTLAIKPIVSSKVKDTITLDGDAKYDTVILGNEALDTDNLKQYLQDLQQDLKDTEVPNYNLLINPIDIFIQDWEFIKYGVVATKAIYDDVSHTITGAFGFHQNLNLDISSHSSDVLVIGNDGSDALIGGSGNDTIIGGGDLDILIGNAGDDVLISAKYDFSSSDFSLKTLVDKYQLGNDMSDNPLRFEGVDVSFQYGGKGNDILYGEYGGFTRNEDNDYLFIDVNPITNAENYSNDDNVDTIKYFFKDTIKDVASQDYIVLSAEQLEIDFGVYKTLDESLFSDADTSISLSDTIDAFHWYSTYDNTLKDGEGDTRVFFESLEDFNSYDTYGPILSDSNRATFVLDGIDNAADLWFDRDGKGNEYDLIKLATIESPKGGLNNFDLDQLLIVQNFDFLENNIILG